MTTKRVVGILMVAVIALAWVGCKKKPADKAKGDKAAMTAMDVMRPVAMRPEAMRPEAMRPAPKSMSVVAVKMEKPTGMVVIPKGKNPLAGVDISKGFGEGWFKKGQPGMTQPAMPAPLAMTPTAPVAMSPAAPVTMAPVMAVSMAPVAMAPAGMRPAPAAKAKTKPKPLPYTRYTHPDKTFAFRHPTGWTPKVKVGKVKGVPTFFIQVQKVAGKTDPGELGSLAFVQPKKAPDSRTSCKQLISIVKKGAPGLKTGPLRPLQKTGLFMFQAMAMVNGKKQVSLCFCGTAHKRIQILSWFSVGQDFASGSYGYQLGVALYTFTSDLLKK